MLEFEDVPELTDPVLIAAFEGWNDAGEAATSAVRHLAEVWDAEVVAALDPEEYYDFQVNRPRVSLEDGRRMLSWPTTRILVATETGLDRDVVLVQGIEPSMRWRAFSIELLELAEQLGVTTIVTVGALLADVPHTRPIPVTATAEDEAAIHRFDVEASRYEGPTGIVGSAEPHGHRLRHPDRVRVGSRAALRRWRAVAEGDPQPAAPHRVPARHHGPPRRPRGERPSLGAGRRRARAVRRGGRRVRPVPRGGPGHCRAARGER